MTSAAKLPEGLVAYRKTDVFTQDTVPKALLRAHSTKPGTWGLIHVIEGRLRYSIEDERREPCVIELTPETQPGVVEPTVLHAVTPLGAVRFLVEFHRAG